MDSYIPNFVYDRTEESYLNYDDLNRIENNIKWLYKKAGIEYTANAWELGDIPRTSYYTKLLNDINKLKEKYTIEKDTPETPTQPLNIFSKWNDIEKILNDMYVIFIRTQNSQLYAGIELIAGEQIGVI